MSDTAMAGKQSANWMRATNSTLFRNNTMFPTMALVSKLTAESVGCVTRLSVARAIGVGEGVLRPWEKYNLRQIGRGDK